MDCQSCRNALSASLDGEELGCDPRDLMAHLDICAVCAKFANNISTMNAATDLVVSRERVPDMVAFVLAQNPPIPPRRRVLGGRRAEGQPVAREAYGHQHEWIRYALMTVALTQLVLSLPSLFGGSGLGIGSHMTRELGSWTIALSLGLLYVAWKPEKAAGLLPFAAPLVVMIIGSAIVDIAGRNTTLATESAHLLEIAGVGLLVTMSRPLSFRWRRATPAPAL